MTLEAIFSRLDLNGYGPAVLMVVSAMGLFLWQKLRIKMDPREPPLIKPWIPFIGHLIGLLRYNQGYLEKLSLKSTLPAFTLPVFTGKMYVISGPELQQVALRSQTLDFDHFIVEFGIRLMGCGPEAAETFRRVPEDPKEVPFLRGFHKVLHEHMLPGPKVQQMNAAMLGMMVDEVNDIHDEVKDSLYVWLRDSFSVATATAVFGRNNPWAKDQSLMDGFWEFEKNVLYLISGIMPSIFAPKAFKGRLASQKALEGYFNAGHDTNPDVSPYEQARAEHHRKFGFPNAELGKFEIASIFVALSNATPTFFWLLLFIVSDAELTKDIRVELGKIVTTTAKDEYGRREATIDIRTIASSCPLLYSAFQETMRLTDGQTATRIVTEDTILSDGKDSILLQKGATVQLPSGAMHSSPTIWGPDVGRFNPRRFLKPVLDPLQARAGSEGDRKQDKALSEKDKDLDKLRKKAFAPFGGGIHLCPGRHFATAEILGSVALMLMGFEIAALGGGLLAAPKDGEWKMIKFGEAVAKPMGRLASIGARVTRRTGWEDVKWGFETGWKAGGGREESVVR